MSKIFIAAAGLRAFARVSSSTIQKMFGIVSVRMTLGAPAWIEQMVQYSGHPQRSTLAVVAVPAAVWHFDDGTLPWRPFRKLARQSTELSMGASVCGICKGASLSKRCNQVVAPAWTLLLRFLHLLASIGAVSFSAFHASG